MTPLEALMLLYFRLSGIKIIWTFHNKRPHCDDNKINKANNLVFWFMTIISNTIFIHSKHSVRWLLDYNRFLDRKKIVYLPHVNYFGCYKESGTNIRKEYGISSDTLVFLMFGQIRPYKNIELLLKTMSSVQNKDVKLLVAGKPVSNAYARKVEKLAHSHPNVILSLGEIPDKLVADYLNAADVLILPYNTESSMNSGVMMTAFSYRKTVIIPNIDMAKDIQTKDFFFCYQYSNMKEHEEALRMMLKDASNKTRSELQQIGDEAFEHMVKYHDNQSVRKVLLSFL